MAARRNVARCAGTSTISELPRVGTKRGMIKAYRRKTLNCAPVAPEQAKPRRVTETRDRGRWVAKAQTLPMAGAGTDGNTSRGVARTEMARPESTTWHSPAVTGVCVHWCCSLLRNVIEGLNRGRVSMTCAARARLAHGVPGRCVAGAVTLAPASD